MMRSSSSRCVQLLHLLFGLILSQPLCARQFIDTDVDDSALPKVPPGFEITVFAKEPLVRQACSMAFDAKGRLFVGMGPQYRNPTPETPGDSVVIFLDNDRDGTADTTKRFATGFNAIQGLAWHGRDLWVANSPDLTVVRDTDGDDEADEYTKLFTDLGNLEHGLHGLNWAPDGKLYMSKGNSKGLTQPGHVAPKAFRDLWGVTAPPGSPDFPAPTSYTKENYQHSYHAPDDDWGLCGGILRCDDGGHHLEIVARGFRNPWDITLDSGFNWLGTDNDQTQGDRVVMPFWGANFGWNHPWSSHWTDEPHAATAPVSGPMFEGSGTGLIFYDAPQFPPEYRGVYFINDWLSKTTYAWKPSWDGALQRPAGGSWTAFIEGGKSLFRPTDIEVGPDGALWILGWSKGYGAEWKDGQLTNEGRIFRVAWKGPTAQTIESAQLSKPLSELSVQELILDFASPIPVRRIDAQDELVRRGPIVKAELIARLNGSQLTEQQETWTVWALGRMVNYEPILEDFLDETLASPKTSLNLKIQAIRILAHRYITYGFQRELIASLEKALSHAEPRLRLAAVLAFQETKRTDDLSPLLAQTAVEPDATIYYAQWQTLRALLSTEQLQALLSDERSGVRRAAMLALFESNSISRETASKLSEQDSSSITRDLAKLWLAKTNDGVEQVVIRGKPLSNSPEPIVIATRAIPTILEETLPLLKNGNSQNGSILFHHPQGVGCFKCHSLSETKNGFGPNLSNIGQRSNERHIVQSILEPSAVITEGFNQTLVRLEDGTVYSGVLLNESGITLSLGLSTGEQVDIPKALIEQRQVSKSSAMPSTAELLSPQQVADLTAFLMSQQGKATTSSSPNNSAASQARFSFEAKQDQLNIQLDGIPIAEFVFRDDKILRPYFSNLQVAKDVRLTRNHPPIEGVDAMDHDTMHPGIWLGFGDINDNDFWRNKASIEFIRFPHTPIAEDEQLRFVTESHLISNEGKTICLLTSKYTLRSRPSGWSLIWDATFHTSASDVSWGDQEEMGFGARVATALTEKNGGLIRSSAGLKTAAGTWGKPADWCDYSGKLGDGSAGIQLMSSPNNFRTSWWHNRDYGVFVANPFGRQAMQQGDKSTVTIRPGETLRVVFGAVLHMGPNFDPEVEFKEFKLQSTAGAQE